MNRIETALSKLFEKHQVVFWYDEHGEFQQEFESLELPDINKVVLDNNAFGLKHRILREDRKEKFLIYQPKAEPEHKENWFLDIQLANIVFRADKPAMWLAELKLAPSFRTMLEEHRLFLESDTRRAALVKRLDGEESQQQLWLKMCAVCLGSSVDARLESILLSLLENLAESKTEKYEMLEKFALLPQLWKELARKFGYQSKVLHINDFAIKLFESGFRLSMDSSSELNHDALIFLNQWKDSLQGQQSFETLAEKFEKELQLGSEFNHYDIQRLLSCDLFRGVDRRILEDLMERTLNESMNSSEMQEISQQRRGTHWYKAQISFSYKALHKAVSLLELIRTAKMGVNNLQEGFNRYTKEWYRGDQLYREYLYFMRQAGQSGFFSRLNDKIEAQYCNNFLLAMNNNWQAQIDLLETWKDQPAISQREFFGKYVKEILASGAKAAVIISDALRYEAAEALSRRVEEEGRFATQLDWMVAMLPSYTALGMAALLPNNELSIQTDNNVKVDGVSSAGMENRKAILAKAVNGEANALSSGDLKTMTAEERRTLFRENQVVYVYHNRIDMLGDKRESEDQTVDAVHDTIEELVTLVKLLRSANFTKILVTADHGFLYQYQKLDEVDLTSPEVDGKEIYLRKRRFVIGKGLKNEGNQLKHFNTGQLGLAGECEILVAKSVNRMRLSGAGMQFVHGGSSLQEIIIPVLSVNKMRGAEHEAHKVEVDRLSSTTSNITTGQLSVNFMQLEKLGPKVLSRTLSVAIYAEDGTKLSDSVNLYFGSESDNQRDWEVSVRLMLSQESFNYNRQNVQLRLEEQRENSDKFRTYRYWTYFLNRTQFADF